MSVSVIISFLAGWTLGGFAVYSYLALSTRGQTSVEAAGADDDAERLTV